MKSESLAFVLWIAAGISLVPAASAQELSRAEVEAILVRTVTHILESQPAGKYTHPVLLSAGIDDDLALAAGIDTTALAAAVSSSTGVPIWDGVKYCDMTRPTHHWRMTNADFRLDPTLDEVNDGTALVRVSLSGGSSMAGIVGRTLQLVRADTAWRVTGFVGPIMHLASTPCDRPGE